MKAYESKRTSGINFISVALPVLIFTAMYWVFDAVTDSFYFRETDFLTSLLNPDKVCLSMRLLNLPIIIVFAVIVQWMLVKRKSAEEALHVVKSRLEHLLINNPVVIYSSKPSGDFGATFISENIIKQMGYESHEFIDDPEFWSNNIHPDDAPRVLKELSGLFDLGYHSHEYRFKLKNGDYRWMYDEMKLVRDNEGNPVEIVGYWADITDRKQMEEQRDKLIAELQKAISEVKTLRGFLPICSHCKNIRDDKGYWSKIELYINKHSDAEFSHGICPECAKQYYPKMDLYDDAE